MTAKKNPRAESAKRALDHARSVYSREHSAAEVARAAESRAERVMREAEAALLAAERHDGKVCVCRHCVGNTEPQS